MIDAQFSIGQLLDETARRDAVHFALFPAVAAERLSPGTRVGLAANGTIAMSQDEAIGIVDPFLPETVHTGERCWVFLFPNTITSLRHEWTHPVFDGGEAKDPLEDIKAESMQWLSDFGKDIGLPYSALMAALDDWVYGGDRHLFSGVDTPERCYRDSTDMWRHYALVTGRQPENMTDVPFSCAC